MGLFTLFPHVRITGNVAVQFITIATSCPGWELFVQVRVQVQNPTGLHNSKGVVARPGLIRPTNSSEVKKFPILLCKVRWGLIPRQASPDRRSRGCRRRGQGETEAAVLNRTAKHRGDSRSRLTAVANLLCPCRRACTSTCLPYHPAWAFPCLLPATSLSQVGHHCSH